MQLSSRKARSPSSQARDADSSGIIFARQFSGDATNVKRAVPVRLPHVDWFAIDQFVAVGKVTGRDVE